MDTANCNYTAAYQSPDIAEPLQVTVEKSPSGRTAAIKPHLMEVLCPPPPCSPSLSLLSTATSLNTSASNYRHTFTIAKRGDGDSTMQHFCWVLGTWVLCASQRKQLSSVHQQLTHSSSPSQSLGKILRRGRWGYTSLARSTEQGCPCCRSWWAMDMITPGRVLACQHVGFWYSVSLESQWLSLCLDRI